MMLLLGLVVLVVVVAASAPASYDARQGQKHYDECRARQQTYLRDLARETDTYYTGSAVIGINDNFYSDGSLKFDPTTGKSYSKGQYKCRSDGLTADYTRAGNDVKRPPRE